MPRYHAWFLMLVVLAGQITAGEPTTPAASAVQRWTAIVNGRKRVPTPRAVISPYYAWYVGTGRWGTIVPETIANPVGGKASRVWDRPVLGFYDSREDELLTAHMIWASRSGIDVLAVSFAGRLPEGLLEKAQAYGVRIAPYLEFMEKTNTGKPFDFLAAARNLADYRQRFPSAIYCIDDRPVIFAYKRTLIESSPSFWAESLLKLHGEGLEFTVLGDISATDKSRHLDVYTDIFDGLHSYHVLFTMRQDPTGDQVRDRCTQLYNEEYTYARRHNRIICLTVMPGWDNRTVNNPGMVVDRLDGQIYEGMWKAALATGSGPDLVMVTSFNEWYEGGTIEPGTTTGSRYLDLTRAFAARFKGRPDSDGSLTLASTERYLLPAISGIKTPKAEVPLLHQGPKRDAAVSLQMLVTAWGGSTILVCEQKDGNPVRININGGGRMRNGDRRGNDDWFNGTAWDGKRGDWYYRFDGAPRLEAVFGTHHVVVFLQGSRMAIVDGSSIQLEYPAILSGNDAKDVLVPISLFTKTLGIPLITKARPAPTRPTPASPPATPKLKQAPAAWHSRLVAKLQTVVAKGRGISIVLGNNERHDVEAVTITGITARTMDSSITMPWRIIDIEQMASMASQAVADDDLEALLIAAVWNQAAGRAQLADDYFAKAALIDANASRAAHDGLMSPP
jgi:hypothetical protein